MKADIIISLFLGVVGFIGGVCGLVTMESWNPIVGTDSLSACCCRSASAGVACSTNDPACQVSGRP